MKAIGNTAASIANNTRYKVDEVTIQNRRREVLGDLANKAYALWLKGETFPESMTRMLEELKQLDEQLNDIRAENMLLPLPDQLPPMMNRMMKATMAEQRKMRKMNCLYLKTIRLYVLK